MRLLLTYALSTTLFMSGAMAQVRDNPEIEACKASGLITLKERFPAVKDIILDMETFNVSKANTKIEDIAVHTIIMGEVYIERKETGAARQFLCIVGEKGKVLLTFFATP
jgi:hypothetical protein